jgi:DNA-binding NarL/FixJ family response regulator
VHLLVADDSHDWRQELRGHLERLSMVQIVAETADGHEALVLSLKLRPQLAIVSVSVPVYGGFEVLRSIKRFVPDCNVVLVTRCPDPLVETTGILLGAKAVCSKTEGLESVLGIIERILDRQDLSGSTGG